MFRVEKKYLPSKKFIQALSAAVVIVLIALVLSYWRPSADSYKNTLVTDATSTWMNNNIDSDNDGLPDWQETLYGTDPHNPDTDGDGTSDGEEVKEGRDPLKANTAPKGQTPNDYVDASIIAANQKEIADYQALNPTDKMSRDLISNVIASQPVNGSMNQDTANSIVDQTIQDIPQKNYSASTTADDLHFIPIDQVTPQNVTNYTNQYYQITENYRQIMNQDLSVVNDYIASTTSITDAKKKINKITTEYQTIINNLIRLPIPAIPGSLPAVFQLKIINDLEKLIQIDNDMINAGSEITIVYSGMQSYGDVLTDLTTALSTMDAAGSITRQ